jgi:hypothetical protein
MDIFREFLLRYDREGDKFLCNIVTRDESWVLHFKPENKRQSMEYRHKGSPAPMKFNPDIQLVYL